MSSTRFRRIKRLGAALTAGALGVGFLPIAALSGTASAAAPTPTAVDTSAFCANTPPDNPFTDLPASDVHFDNVLCMAFAEITLGTTPTTYSPSTNVRRDQMASFIARSIDKANELEDPAGPDAPLTDLPASAPDAFGDDSGDVHETNINRLADAGVVNGLSDAQCVAAGATPPCYGPAQPVTRAQMASFINRAIGFLTGTPLSSSTDFFDDDNGNVHEDNINGLASVGIVQGTGGGNYNPNAPVPRDQMGSFIIRMLAYLNSIGDIGILQPPAGPGQDFTVDPSGPTFTQVSTAFGTANGERASRLYTAHVGNASVVDIALIPATNVTVNPDGTVTFKDSDAGLSQQDRADGLGATGCRIEQVNGVTLAGGTTDGNDYVDSVGVTNGTVTFLFNCETANQFVLPVVFTDSDNNNQLNLNADNTPSEPFGIGGAVLVVPQDQTTGTFTSRVVIAPKIIDLFTTGPAALGFPEATYHYDSNDTYHYEADVFGGVPGQNLTLDQFETFLSGATSTNRSDAALGAGYTNSIVTGAGTNARLVLGDEILTSYNDTPAAQSDFNISRDVSDPVSDVAAAAADTDADGTTDDAKVTWTRPANLDINRFDIFRSAMVTGAQPAGSFTLVGTVPTVAGQTAYTFNDQNVPAATSPERQFAYIVLAVNTVSRFPGGGANDTVERSPDSNIATVTMPAASNTARPAITATSFTNGSNVGNNPAIVDAQDVLTMTLTNPLITVTAGASVDLRDDDGDLFRLTNGSNATFSVGGPSSDTVTIVLTGAPTVVEDGPNPVSALEAPTGGSFAAVFATTGIANANGGLNLAESGLTAAEATSIGITTARTRVFGGTNALLPDELSDPDAADPDVNNNVDVNADTDQVIIKGTAGSGLSAGDTILVFDKNGVQVGSATYPAAPPPSGFPIAISPGFAQGDRLYLVYVDNDGVGTFGAPSRMPSETEALSNPSDIPTATVTPNPQPPGNHLTVVWTDDDGALTQTGPANSYTVFDTQNSVLVATATAVAGSPGNTFTLTLDHALTAGNYVLRIAANTVQDPNNTPNVAETHAFTIAVPVNQAPTIAINGGPANASTISSNTPAFNGTAADADGNVTDVQVQLNGGAFNSIGGANISGEPGPNVTWSFTTSTLPEGSNTVCFQSVDNSAATSTPACRTFTVNALPATVTSAVVLPGNTGGPDLRITFSEAVDCNGTGNNGALTGDAFAWTDSSDSGSGNTHGHANDSFALNSAATVAQGPSATTCDIDAPTVFNDGEDFGALNYTQPVPGADQIRDAFGTPVNSFSTTANDAGAPHFETVTANVAAPGTITVVLNDVNSGAAADGEAVLCAQVQPTDFSVTVNNTPVPVASVTCGTGAFTASDTITLTLPIPLIAGNQVTVTAVANSVPNQQGTGFLSGSASDTA
jgi:hypothetical protein